MDTPSIPQPPTLPPPADSNIRRCDCPTCTVVHIHRRVVRVDGEVCMAGLEGKLCEEAAGDAASAAAAAAVAAKITFMIRAPAPTSTTAALAAAAATNASLKLAKALLLFNSEMIFFMFGG